MSNNNTLTIFGGAQNYGIRYANKIYQVFKVMHPTLGMSSQGMKVVEGLVAIVGERMCHRINTLIADRGVKTVNARVVLSATDLVFGRELGQHARSEIRKAITKYKNTEGGTKSSKKSKTERADLIFSVSRAERLIRTLCTKERVSPLAAVSLAAVLEYITAEVVELAGLAALEHKHKRIKPRDIMLVLSDDRELNDLFSHTIVPNSGFAPNNPRLKGGARPTNSFISKRAIMRLASRAGVTRVSGLMYEEINGVIEDFVGEMMRAASSFTLHEKRKTMNERDVMKGLECCLGLKFADIGKQRIQKRKPQPSKPKSSIQLNYGSLRNLFFGGKKASGTVALRRIRHLQKSSEHLISRAAFKRVVTSSNTYNVRFTPGALKVAQEALEHHVIRLLQDTLTNAINAKRVTIMPKDMLAAMRIRNELGYL